MDLEDLGDLGDEIRRDRLARPILVAHEDERQERQADGVRIDAGGVALDDAALLEFADPFEDRGGRKVDLPGDLGIRRLAFSCRIVSIFASIASIIL